MESLLSKCSDQDQNYPASLLSSSCGPPSDGDLTSRGFKYESLRNSYSSPEIAVPSRESSTELPLFNIERDGHPDIQWYMYYDFKVTKCEAYYQLQPCYLPTDKYPSRVKSEKVIM
jgi:hypothetical protein